MDSRGAALPQGDGLADATSASLVELRTAPLALIDGVESLIGANGSPMLFAAETGRYTRLSPAGLRVTELLDGERTGDDLVALLARGDEHERQERERRVLRFLSELRQAGLLTLEPVEEGRRERAARAASRELLWRRPLVRDVGTRLEPLAARVRSVPPPVLRGVLATLLLAALALVVAVLAQGLPDPESTVWWVVIPLLLVQLAFHETGHALVSRVHGVAVREAGIGLLFYFWPIAYVDRTDAYRLRERSKRASIVLAGPGCDLLFAGGYALIALLASGSVSETARAIVVIECFAIFSTFNPLLPSDGYHALEAASGELNLRSRAFGYFGHRVTGVEAPSALASISRGRGRFYLLFAVACALYMLVLVGGMVATILGFLGIGPLA